MKTRRIDLAQSTVELAMLLPLVFALLYWIVQIYRAHYNASDRAISQHREALFQFNHGQNLGPVVIDGVEMIPGHVEELIPDSGSFGNLLGGLGFGTLEDYSLSNIFNNVPFLKDDTIPAGYARGWMGSAYNTYMATSQVDWQSARAAGYSGAIGSGQMKHYLQGRNDMSPGYREMVGSGVQSAGLAYARDTSHDPQSAIAGGVYGGLYSDTSSQWMVAGNDILKGAARGAIAGSISGLADGNLTLGKFLSGTTTGAFYTPSIAKAFPWADESHPLSAASFNATNEALSVLLVNRQKTEVGDLLLAASTGAYFSGQSQSALTGENRNLASAIKGDFAQSMFFGAVTGGMGGDSEAVGRTVYASLMGSAASTAVEFSGRALRSVLSGAHNSVEANRALENPRTEAAVRYSTIQKLGGMFP